MNKNRLKIANKLPQGSRLFRMKPRPCAYYDFRLIPCIKGLYIQD